MVSVTIMIDALVASVYFYFYFLATHYMVIQRQFPGRGGEGLSKVADLLSMESRSWPSEYFIL